MTTVSLASFLSTEVVMSKRLSAHQWAETIASIQGVLIAPDDQGIVVTFKVAPPASFHGELVDGLAVYFVMERGRDIAEGTEIPGKLFLGSHRPVNGLACAYRFIPRHPEDRRKVIFSGLNHWSNIAMVKLMTPPGPRVTPNLFRHTARSS